MSDLDCCVVDEKHRRGRQEGGERKMRDIGAHLSGDVQGTTGASKSHQTQDAGRRISLMSTMFEATGTQFHNQGGWADQLLHGET